MQNWKKEFIFLVKNLKPISMVIDPNFCIGLVLFTLMSCKNIQEF